MIEKMAKLVLTLCLILGTTICYAQEPASEAKNETRYNPEDVKGTNYNFITLTGEYVSSKDFKLGPGMEVISIKGLHIVVPKSTRVEDRGSWVKVEDLGEFLGRRFDETEDRLQRLEKKQEIIIEELGQIKKTLDELSKRSSASN